MVRQFAMVFGVIYLLVGILGFIPGINQMAQLPGVTVDMAEGRLLGLFPVNAMHNLVHILIGIWGIASSRSYDGAIGFARGLTIVYVILAIAGLIPGLNTLFGLAPLYSHDIWLHAGSALIAAYFGWMAPRTADTAR